jgi:NAD-dependent SIR2 family protein deacetylase
MKLYPLADCVRDASNLIHFHGASVFQQFNCAKCGAKQTMSKPNVFYKSGHCEGCGHITNIEADGCNYMAMFGGRL